MQNQVIVMELEYSCKRLWHYEQQKELQMWEYIFSPPNTETDSLDGCLSLKVLIKKTGTQLDMLLDSILHYQNM